MILVNGSEHECAGQSVAAVLELLGLSPDARGVAVAVKATVARAPTRAAASARVK